MGSNYTRTTQPIHELYNGLVPRESLSSAEAILLGAMLREPSALALNLPMLNRVALSTATNGLDKVFEEIIGQHAERGVYSSVTVSQKTGVAVSEYAYNFSEVDLGWAVSHWWEEYSKWAECTAIAHGLSAQSDGMFAMRSAIDKMRIDLGLMEEVTRATYTGEDFARQATDKLEGREQEPPLHPHAKTLKAIVPGFFEGDLIIIAGRPGMGKTQFALNLHNHFAKCGIPGAFVSLEMPTSQIMYRMLGIRHGINNRADWSMLDKDRVERAILDVSNFCEQKTVVEHISTLEELEAYAVSKHFSGELQYLIVDYLSLLQVLGKYGNREQEVAHISRSLKRLARRLKIPVIALQQLSRSVETRGGSKRPQLSDLRESGSIEQDASVVMFLYRPEYYGITEDESGESLEGVGEVIVAKHRNGETGVAKMAYNPISGYVDIKQEAQWDTASKTPPFSTQFPALTPAIDIQPDFTSARPKATDDIPF